jgi:hypothetical protein
MCRFCGHDYRVRRANRVSLWSELRKRIPGYLASSIVLVALLVTGAFFMFRGAGYSPELRARFVNSCGLPGACGCLLEHLETQGVPGSAVTSFLQGDLARSTSVFDELDNGLVICSISEGPDALVSETASTLRNAAHAEESYAALHGTFTYNVDNLQGEGFAPPGEVTIDVVEAGPAGYCIEARHADLEDTYFLDSDRSTAATGNC